MPSEQSELSHADSLAALAICSMTPIPTQGAVDQGAWRCTPTSSHPGHRRKRMRLAPTQRRPAHRWALCYLLKELSPRNVVLARPHEGPPVSLAQTRHPPCSETQRP